MAACPSCVKSVCQCHKEDKQPKPNLIKECVFSRGIHSNVTIEIGEDCQVVSMRPADIEQISLCDPCEFVPEPSDDGDQYELGYEAAKDTYYSIGYTEGYEDGRAEGVIIGKSEGYGIGYAEGVDSGFQTGLAQGKLEVDCDVRYNEGYNAGYDDAKAEQQQSVEDVMGGLSTKQALGVEYLDVNGNDKKATVQFIEGVWISDDANIKVNPKDGSIEIEGSTIQPDSVVTVKPITIDENQHIVIDTDPCPEPEPIPIPEEDPVVTAKITTPNPPSNGGSISASILINNAPMDSTITWRVDIIIQKVDGTLVVTKGVLDGTEAAENGLLLVGGHYPAVPTVTGDTGYAIVYARYTQDGKNYETPYEIGTITSNAKKLTIFQGLP